MTAVRLLPRTPLITRQYREELDTHVVASEEVPPNEEAPECVVCAKFAPWKVTVAEPVVARFPVGTELMTKTSYVNDSVVVERRSPDVTTILFVRDRPPAAWQFRIVSEIHELASQAENPMRGFPVNAKDDRPCPMRVTLDAPVPTELTGDTMLACQVS